MVSLQNADLAWDEQGQPLSNTFGDVYFSKASGLEETRHVFIQHNQLPLRFSALEPQQCFSIAETGFGTGLNFLCAWQSFEQWAPPQARLHYISVEKFPLSLPDLKRALALWPELKRFADELTNAYAAIHPGFQRITLAQGRVSLTLLIGDVLEQLPELEARIDAWFLDGFSPAKNPDMWSEALFSQLARLSTPNTTLATFTSAGFVRRGLIAAGFAMQRVKGFGHKREMLAGPFTGLASPTPNPWYHYPETTHTEQKAIVLGAGLAGCSAAHSLAIRGWAVQLIDQNATLASETSGNPQGVLYLKLSANQTPLSRYILSGHSYTRRLLENLPQGEQWAACGVLQMPSNNKEQARHAQLATAFAEDLVKPLEQTQAEALAGVKLPSGGLFFPSAGWASPPALCQYLATHPNIEQRLQQPITRLTRHTDQWQLWQDDQLIAQAPILVLANAAQINALMDLQLPVKRIRGQITQVAATPASRALKTVICAQGYVAPPANGQHTLGAGFRFNAQDLTPTAEEHQENLELLQALSTDLFERLELAQTDPSTLEGRAGFRCTTPDYLPLVGPVSDPQHFMQTYQRLRLNAKYNANEPCPWLKGLYVSSAHGSRGLISAPLAGELLAAWINNEALPLPASVAHACHPNRFVLRRVIRGSDSSTQ